ANNTGSASYTPQQADLAVTKTVDNPTPTVGDTVTFTVTLKNNGASDATGVTVHDVLPAGLALVTATPGQGTYDSASGTWTAGTLASRVSTTLVLRATVTGTGAATNVASVLASDVFDPKLANNTAQAVVTPQLADLHLVKSVSDPTPNVGDTVTFTVTLTNSGPNTATNVTVNDLLPAGLQFVSATPSQGTYNSTTGVWTVGTVTTTTPLTLQIRGTVASPDARTNTAVVSHVDQFDPNPTNDTSSSTATPQRADLQLTKSVSSPAPNVGDTISFTVTLANLGPDAATNVAVQDLLPTGLTFVSATPSQGTYNGTTGVWTVGTVTTTTPQTLTIQAIVASS